MKKVFLIAVIAIKALAAAACPVCERNQPRILRGIIHGGGPESRWDYWIVCCMLTIVVLTLFFSVKLLIRPGEKSPDHIKNSILNPTWL
ncbi:MAG TPA: hypothetical protein VGS79_22085 [Puia sp.]|nr:hypothetical protein [Puia sp.]